MGLLFDFWTAAATQQLLGGNVRLAIFCRIATSPEPIRIWGGDGQFEYPYDDEIETAGALYAGFGLLKDALPAVNQLINGEASRVEFGLSGAGVSTEVASLASASAASIRSVEVDLGFLALDQNQQPLSPTAWLWEGIADTLKVSRTGSKEPYARALTLSCASLLSGRRRSTPLFWTPQDQATRSSTDRVCERVPEYNAGTTLVWPKN